MTTRELSITRLIDAPRSSVFRAWTDPGILKTWWAPKPFTTQECSLDVRSGGTFSSVMVGPDGTKYPGSGVYLEVVPDEKIVFTDAYTSAWVPSDKAFMTVVITFADEGGKTRYTARVLHWSEADREAHEKMGFEQGWGQCAEQLAEVAAKI